MLLVLSAKLGGSHTTLVLENVHDMDSPSWRLLRLALVQLKPMMVLLTMRPIKEEHKHHQLREIEAGIERAPPWVGGRSMLGERARHKMKLGGLAEAMAEAMLAPHALCSDGKRDGACGTARQHSATGRREHANVAEESHLSRTWSQHCRSSARRPLAARGAARPCDSCGPPLVR